MMLPLDALNLVAPTTFRSDSLPLTVWPTTVMDPVPEIGPREPRQPGGSCPGPVSPSSHSGLKHWHSEKPVQSDPHRTHAFITDLHLQNGQYSQPDVRSRPGTRHVAVFSFLGSQGPPAGLRELAMFANSAALPTCFWASWFTITLTPKQSSPLPVAGRVRLPVASLSHHRGRTQPSTRFCGTGQGSSMRGSSSANPLLGLMTAGPPKRRQRDSGDQRGSTEVGVGN